MGKHKSKGRKSESRKEYLQSKGHRDKSERLKRKRKYSSSEDSEHQCTKSKREKKSPFPRCTDKLSKHNSSADGNQCLFNNETETKIPPIIANDSFKESEKQSHRQRFDLPISRNSGSYSKVSHVPHEETSQCKVIKQTKVEIIESVSEEDIMFNWKDYTWELNRLFFADGDLIKKGTVEYTDFWKFLQKYQALNKQKKIKSMCQKGKISHTQSESCTPKFDLPSNYDKRYCINFALRDKDIRHLQDRLPPVDFEDNNVRRLSIEKLQEFKFVLLLYLDFVQKEKFKKLKNIRGAQNNLPIAEYKSKIIETVRNNTVTILAGDTGCGKSTQIPQYLLAAGYTDIACTQPRRIACISLSKRVAYETLNEYGSSVGFQIRFEKRKTDHTKIVFLTEGLLLRQIASDPMLLKYNVVILDEIHERHLQTDFLLGVMKCLILQRPQIKIILMSATINISLFSNYFMGTAPVIQIPGRLYPIELKYFPIGIVEKSSKSEKLNPAPYVRILQLIDKSYPSDERGDLLMFLSGMKEITTVMDAAKIYAQQSNKWVILQLHSSLSVSEQEKVFDVPPEGIRKCIISTNIAETSVTIDGVRFVVDSGKVKEMSYDPVHKMQKLKEFWISQASAEQRKGRSGRTGPGVCFRLFSEEEYNSFVPYTSPEILRVPLDSLVLQMISMGLPNIKLFPFIEPPTSDSLDMSLASLMSHSALSPDQDLTSIGSLLSQLPLDVSLGKMLIMGSLFHQLGPVLSLAAAMSVQSPFTNRAYRDPDCVVLNKSLQSNHGDPFTLLMAYREWLYIKTKGCEDSRRWCKKRGLEEQRFYEMTKLRQQFSQMLRESGLHALAQDDSKYTSSSERAKRYGELSHLRQMKRDLFKQGPRKTQILRVDHEGGTAEGDDEAERDVGLEIKDIDFKIRYDDARLRELYRDSRMDSAKDVMLLKIILCSGLYPNLGIADEHNNYKPGSDQLFHTAAKPFVVLHPNSVFASEPEALQLTQPDIVALKGFTERHPCSSRHQVLSFVSLLETNKAYLVNAVRAPSAQTLLLFSRSLDTNADLSILVCDNFIELKFADRIGAQNLLFRAVSLRAKWESLLDMRIRASKPCVEDPDRLALASFHLEKELSVGLVDLMLSDECYSARRLLAADVKVLHYGPGDAILSPNPFSEEDAPCSPHASKGGVTLTPFLTYNCLIDVDSSVTTITSYDAFCPFCDAELHLTTLERLRHMRLCAAESSRPMGEREEEEEAMRRDPTNKEFWCEVCQRKFWLSIREILKHKKRHAS